MPPSQAQSSRWSVSGRRRWQGVRPCWTPGYYYDPQALGPRVRRDRRLGQMLPKQPHVPRAWTEAAQSEVFRADLRVPSRVPVRA